MDAFIKKPYEISVWEDRLVSDGEQSWYEEYKLAVIGSDTMTGLNKVYNPIFTPNVNGQKTLTFYLKYKYFDPSVGEEVINPFAALLVNERKIKLKYEDKWYDLRIKEHTESTDERTWTYTAEDAFILELSKNGYNIEFSSDLNNNQGTAEELAKATLKNTDWQVKDCDIDRQTIKEPLYKATLRDNFEVLNTDTNEFEVIDAGTEVYVFYTYVLNKDGKYLEFILQSNEYVIDDDNAIVATNYRVPGVGGFNGNIFSFNGNIIDIGEIETKYQAYRLVYKQLTTYDPVLERTVKKYTVEDSEDTNIYSYVDYEYTTSDILTNFVVNGSNFNEYDEGTLQGWDKETPYTLNGNIKPSMELITYPRIDKDIDLISLAKSAQVTGYLELKFNGALTYDYRNTFFNDGINTNSVFISSIAAGEEFVLRWRAGKSPLKYGAPNGSTTITRVDDDEIGAIVARYDRVEWTDAEGTTYFVKQIDPEGIILHFNGEASIGNNYVTGGMIETAADGTSLIYMLDGVVQEPSMQYVYVDDNEQEWIWDSEHATYIIKPDNYIPYYYLTAEALQPISNLDLLDPTKEYGVFLYINSSVDQYYYFEQIELTRYYTDDNGSLITLGNVPTASVKEVERFYMAPALTATADSVETYSSLEILADKIGIDEDLIIPIYNEDSIKILSISASQSNCFNILQTIAETFECWISFEVEHEPNGAISLREDKTPKKYISLRKYAGKDNYAGFKYAVNINNIERTVESDQIVTKLIVDPVTNEQTDTGTVSIQLAESNPSGDSYILNFDYYFNQGLIDNREECEADLLKYYESIKAINVELADLQQKRDNAELALLKLNAKRNVYTELVNTAKDNVSKNLDLFYSLTKVSYEQYVQSQATLDEKLQENDTVVDCVAALYVNSSTINNYSGYLTNIGQEYKKLRKYLYGNETYTFTVSKVTDVLGREHIKIIVSDYITPLKFISLSTGSEYNTSVSVKTFDITDRSTGFEVVVPDGYKLYNNNHEEIESFMVQNAVVQKFTLEPVENLGGLAEQIDKLTQQKHEQDLAFYTKYSRFILEGTWNSQDYIDSELYYLDAVQISQTSAQPKVTYTIDAVEISQLEGYEDYNFAIGDKTYIEDIDFFGWTLKNGVKTPAREEVIISQIEWHLDDPIENLITIQNYKTRFEDLFQRISAAVQTVQYNEATYAKISTVLDEDGTLNQDLLLTALNRLAGQSYNLTSDGSVLIEGEHILVRNLTNTANLVKIESEGIRISSDGGRSWATAISGRGINAGEIYTGQLNTDRILIGNNDNPSFRWDKAGISAYRNDGETYDLKTYVRFDQYGLYGIQDGSAFVANTLEDIKREANFGITWDGFFIKNSYEDGGLVQITSEHDIQVLDGHNNERVKLGQLSNGVYGLRLRNSNNEPTLVTDSNGDITMTGIINATGGNFTNNVTIGNDGTSRPYLIIDGDRSLIKTSNYSDGASSGWMINAAGDAVFNNITARGAIKTAVFEYAEIQSVGGVFLFRPSSTIRSAEIANNEQDLLITVEKPILFKVGHWCKVSNYFTGNNPPDTSDPVTDKILQNNGLTHVYKITGITNGVITLQGAAAMVGSQQSAAIAEVSDLIGGALIDMGNESGNSNYGIGVNSSDNTVNLPARAISLFETVISNNDPDSIKVHYDYTGILGTLPELSQNKVSNYYHRYMTGTQGIYTDNMYIGDNKEYIAFYTDTDDENKKKLKISVSDLVVGYDEDDEEIGLDDRIRDIAGDASDILTSTVFTTFGSKIIDGKSVGIVSVKVSHNGVEVDSINTDIKCGFTVSDRQADIPNPIEGDQYILLSKTSDITSGWGIYYARWYKYTNGAWTEILPYDGSSTSCQCQYDWTIRNERNEKITISSTALNPGPLNRKCIYVDGELIEGRTTFDVAVTL